MQCLLRVFQFYDFTVISFVTLNVNARNGEELFKSERTERHIAAVAVCFSFDSSDAWWCDDDVQLDDAFVKQETFLNNLSRKAMNCVHNIPII